MSDLDRRQYYCLLSIYFFTQIQNYVGIERIIHRKHLRKRIVENPQMKKFLTK